MDDYDFVVTNHNDSDTNDSQRIPEGSSILYIEMNEMGDPIGELKCSPIPLSAEWQDGCCLLENAAFSDPKPADRVKEPAVTSFSTLMAAASSFESRQGMNLERSSEGILNVGWMEYGNFLTYPVVQLPFAGRYLLCMRYSSPDGAGRFAVRDASTLLVYYTTEGRVNRTGGFQKWETLRTTVELPAGDISLQIQILEGGWNLLWWSLEWMGTNKES